MKTLKPLERFDENDAHSIKNVNKYFNLNQMKGNLTYIYSNFACLSIAITRLRKQGIPLSEAIDIVQDVPIKLSQLTGTAELLSIKNYKQFSTNSKDFKLFIIFQKY